MRHSYTPDQLHTAIKESFSLAQVLKKLNIVAAGGNYDTLKKQIKAKGFDTTHFTGKGHLKGRHNPHVPKIPLEEILVENSTYLATDTLRRRLLRAGLFEHRCSSCRLTEWFGDPIPLELDHINGKKTDNRIGNLRMICPNCHAKTPTYRGRNIKRRDDATGRHP